MLRYYSTLFLASIFKHLLLEIFPTISNRAVTLEVTMFIVVVLQSSKKISPDQVKRNRQEKDLSQG